MGFSECEARGALRKANNDMMKALALLTGEQVETSERLPGSDGSSGIVAQMRAAHPSVASIERLLLDDTVQEVRRLAASDPLQAIVAMKELLPRTVLDQLNANAVSLLHALSTPVREEHTLPPPVRTAKPRETQRENGTHEVIDVTEAPTLQDRHEDAIQRLAEMGFDVELVRAMYESCGQNEEMTANLLLETFQ
ncbi:hypothetical protein PINS_up009548 [Pythium insidiosum]|nr:hypothetical protein PINS_up009548 [Pythium insidiosum]